MISSLCTFQISPSCCCCCCCCFGLTQIPLKLEMTSTSSASPKILQRNLGNHSFRPSSLQKTLKVAIFPAHCLRSWKKRIIKTSAASSTEAGGYNNYEDRVMVDEEMERIRRLQNGSDVRGVALVGEKGRLVDLTPPAVEAIAESFGEWVIRGMGNPDHKVRVSLGRDPRVTGMSLSVAVFAGIVRIDSL